MQQLELHLLGSMSAACHRLGGWEIRDSFVGHALGGRVNRSANHAIR